MKELDLLLKNYLEQSYSASSAGERQAFESILQMPDPELYDLILGRTASYDKNVARVIEVLRNFLA